MQTIVIIGASSKIAEECAKEWLKKGSYHLILVGRNNEKLIQMQNDFKIRFPNSIFEVMELQFSKISEIKNGVEYICNSYHPTMVLIAHGLLTPQIDCQNDLYKTQEMLDVNGNSVILFAEAFASFLEKQQLGHIAIIGSVAGDRGRKSNYIYGASKGMLEKYVQGLQHRFAKTPINITLIKPGPTDTPMTIDYKEKGVSLACPKKVAMDIVTGIQKNKHIVYTPGHWKYIMMVIRNLPFFVFSNMDI